MNAEQKKVLVLEIEVPGWYADDLEERAELVAEDLEGAEPPLHFLVTEEMLQADQVEVTALTIPVGMDDRPELAHSHGRIVGARLVERREEQR